VSRSYIPSAPVDNTALVADIVSQVNANTNTKATATQAVVVADGDITQTKLDDITTVNGDISTDVQAINTHVTSENDRVLANIPSNSPIKSLQRGVHQFNANWEEVTVNAVDMAKTQLNVYGVGASESTAGSYISTEVMPMVYLKDATTIYANRYSNVGNTKYTWELIEYV